jgi:hypothetical protein
VGSTAGMTPECFWTRPFAIIGVAAAQPALGFRFRETGCLVETGISEPHSHHHRNDNKELS